MKTDNITADIKSIMISHVSAAAFICICLLSIFQDVAVSASKDNFQRGSVYCRKRTCRFEPDTFDWQKAHAVGTFNETLMSTGWGILDISAGLASFENQTGDDIMFAAGYLEGVFTARQMEDHYINLYRNTFEDPGSEKIIPKLKQWFLKQRNWADNMIKTNLYDPFWRHASYILAQLDGLYAGYRAAESDRKVTLDMFAINFLNALGDLFDLLKVLNKPSVDQTKLIFQGAKNDFNINGHCSALIKVLPGYENIYMSHSSWYSYGATNRIFKHYNLNVSDPYTSARKSSFSSYPGFLESLDDFYILGSGLVMLQTTNNLFGDSLYKYIRPESMFAWQRVRIANMMAHNGKEWTDIISKYNSGTYNNQYMLLDLKLIELGRPLPDNTLWVAEQIPGLVVAQDLTPILRAGYFASYNIPFFEEIYNKSGYSNYSYILDLTYELNPRAKIFRRDQASVKDMDTMKALLRSNDYKNDPYSKRNPSKAICSRPDLKAPDFGGCYDTKVSDFHMAKNFQADIINGPTLGTGLPPFSWSRQSTNVSHVGLPEVYNFPFIRTQPRF